MRWTHQTGVSYRRLPWRHGATSTQVCLGTGCRQLQAPFFIVTKTFLAQTQFSSSSLAVLATSLFSLNKFWYFYIFGEISGGRPKICCYWNPLAVCFLVLVLFFAVHNMVLSHAMLMVCYRNFTFFIITYFSGEFIRDLHDLLINPDWWFVLESWCYCLNALKSGLKFGCIKKTGC